jgi:hypothetical protein
VNFRCPIAGIAIYRLYAGRNAAHQFIVETRAMGLRTPDPESDPEKVESISA